MIELDSLKFTVDTSEVATAVTKVKELQGAITALNVPLKQTANASAAAAKGEAALAVATERVNQEKAKTAKLEANATAAKDKAAVITAKLNKETKEQTSVLERQQNILEFMRQGYSSMDAAVLSTAKAHGALADELKQIGELRKSQRDLIGGNPFDKSVGGLINLQRSLKEVNYEQRLVGEGVELTSKQYKELARDQLRLTETAIGAGKSFEEMAVMLDNNKRQFIETATALNHLTAQEKERERAQREVANAQRAVIREDERIESMLRSLNVAEEQHVSITERATRSIANYERNLRLAGITGEQASKKLAQYRSVILQAHEAEQKMKTDRLSRALAPQISDVVVSLAGGMNPMTVLLQQGLQVRDLIGMSGVAVQDLQKSFKNAASDMVSSITGTAKALGSLFLGALTDAGAAALRFGGNITGLNFALDGMRNKVVALGATDGMLSFFDKFAAGAKLLTGVGILGAITAFITALFAVKEIIVEQSKLSTSLIMTGAALGLNKESAIALSEEYKNLGITTSSTLGFFTELAKKSSEVPSNLELVTKAANDLNRNVGVSFEDTAKVVSELGKDPVDALIKFAIESGRVSEISLKQVIAMKKAGDSAGAAVLAQKLWAEASIEQAAAVYDGLSPIEQVWIDIKTAFSSAWDEFKEFVKGEAVAKVFRTAWQTVAVVASEVWYVLKMTGREIGGIAAQIAAVMTGDFSGAKSIGDQMKADANSARAAQDALIASIMGVGKAQDSQSKSGVKSTESLLANSKAAKKLKDALKDSKKGKTDEEKEIDRLSKISDKYLKTFQHNAIGADAIVGDLTKSQQELVEVLSSPEWNNLPNQAQILAAAYEAIGKEQLNESIKERVKLAKEEFEEYSKFLQKQEDFMKSQEDVKKSLSESADLIAYEASLAGLIPEERAKLLKIKQVELKLSEELLKIDELFLKNSSDWIMARSKAMSNANAEISQINSTISKDLGLQLTDGITDAIVTGLYEGGKAGSKKLRDIIEAELRKPVVIFVQAVVSSLFGSGESSSSLLSKGGNALSSLMSVPSGVFSAVGSGLSSLGGLVNSVGATGIGGALGSLGTVASALGTGMAASFTSMVSAGIGGWASAAGSLLGSGASAGIAAGLGMIAAPLLAVGALWSPLFGRKLKDTGIQGTFGGEQGFKGNTYQFYKGGVFRSDKTKLGKLDSATQSTFANAYQMMTEQMYGMAAVLNINTDALEDFTYKVKFSTKGLKPEEIQKKLLGVFEKVGEAQAKLLLGTYETTTSKTFFGITKTNTTWKPGEFVRDQETALEAIQRLSSSIVAVNTVLNNLNATMLEFSLSGADMASSLVDLFGGVDNFQSAMGTYYEQYYTQEEKLGKLKEYLVGQFESLNIAVPKTIEEYKALVKSQNLTTESGREMFTALVQLSPVFSELSSAVTELTNSIVDEIKRLRGEILGSSTTSLAGTQSQFAIATAAARAGDSSAIASLPELSKAVEEAVKLQAASASDIVRIQAWLISSLTETSAVLGTEVPAFASGGLHAGGVRLVGEQGPELEVTGPSRIYNAAQTSSMLSGSSDNSTLVEEVQMLRAEVRANVVHSAKIARILERVTPDGDSIATTTVTP